MIRLILACLLFACIGQHSVAQDCGDPTPLCYMEFNNIQIDSTDAAPLMADFGACGMAMNGSLYEITTINAGALQIEVENIICDLSIATNGDSLVVNIFTSTNALNPCDPASATSLICANFSTGATFDLTALAADESYYVAIYGEMDALDLGSAECGYTLQIDGPAVEFSMNTPTEPIEVLQGQQVEIEGVCCVGSFLWEGPGLILPDTAANPTIFPPTLDITSNNIVTYTVTGTLGDCVVQNQIVIIVNPNIIPADVITPNGDGINDLWNILYIAGPTGTPVNNPFNNAEVKVFDRWGQIVFSSIGYTSGQEWDGTNGGKKLPASAYYYVIELNVEGIESEPFTGAISLIY